MSLDTHRKCFTVWVDGTEVNDHYLTEEKAVELAQEYIDDGYTDKGSVIVEYVKEQDIKND